ncbi:MAG: hypothetical protein J6X33_03985 [Clostridiales bacterium]|nr:hypothetical protein [Clostridiales bacterium]
MFEDLTQYDSLILDYSVMREFGGTRFFDEMTRTVCTAEMDVYVSKTFKLLHYCMLHQADRKDAAAIGSMKTFCAQLLPYKKLHLVQYASTVAFLDSVKDIPNAVILTTKNGIFTRRLYEHTFELDIPIWVLTPEGIYMFSSIEAMKEELPLPEVSPLASQKKFLDLPVNCSFGDKVRTEKDEVYELSNRLSGGAEGMVFLTDKRNSVAKIYHKNIITPLRWAKLKKICQLGITASGFCLPQNLIFFKGYPVGYMMPMGKGVPLGTVFDGPDAILEAFPDWTRIDVVNTLICLLEKYLYLHIHNCIAGDIQLKNALINNSTSVFLIDMDSIQIANLPCPVGTEEFTDPDLWGKDFAGFVRTLHDEDYSIAMLVFSVLFCGLHPYATRNGAETLREEILGRNFPYDMEDRSDEHIPKGGYNYIWAHIPERLKQMLYDTFKLGKSYETIEWYDAVIEYKEDLLNRRIKDPEAYKVFPNMPYDQKETDITVPDKEVEAARRREELEKKRMEPKPEYVRPQFNNAPKGTYSGARNINSVAYFKNSSMEDPEPEPQPAAVHEEDTPRKRGLLGGLFGGK